jgi:hypothetical protein
MVVTLVGIHHVNGLVAATERADVTGVAERRAGQRNDPGAVPHGARLPPGRTRTRARAYTGSASAMRLGSLSVPAERDDHETTGCATLPAPGGCLRSRHAALRNRGRSRESRPRRTTATRSPALCAAATSTASQCRGRSPGLRGSDHRETAGPRVRRRIAGRRAAVARDDAARRQGARAHVDATKVASLRLSPTRGASGARTRWRSSPRRRRTPRA